MNDSLWSLFWTLYADAPGHVRTLANLALTVGSLGVVLTFWHTAQYAWAVRVLRKAGPRGQIAGRFTDTLSVLKLLGVSDQAQPPISPDAVWEFVTNRLHSDLDARRARVRFLGYLPLLVGLAATMLGLAGLIDQLGLGMSGGVRTSLRGVFLGTLIGVAGSAVVGIASLVLAAAGQYAIAAAETHLYRHVLPFLPDRRINVQIEEAVINTIAERTRTVVAHFKHALTPVAESLATSANSTTIAAEASMRSLTSVAAILEKSGDLRGAATIIADKLSAIQNASGEVAKAAAATLDAAKIEAAVRQQLADAAAHATKGTEKFVQATTALDTRIESLNASVIQVATHGAALTTTTRRVGEAIGAARSAFASLAERIESRNEVEKQRIDALQRALASVDAPLTKLHTVLSAMTQEVETARSATETFRSQAADKLKIGIDENFKALASRLEGVLVPISGILPKAASELNAASKSVRDAVDHAGVKIPDVRPLIQPVHSAVESYTRNAQQLVESLQETNKLLAAATTQMRRASEVPIQAARVQTAGVQSEEVQTAEIPAPAAAGRRESRDESPLTPRPIVTPGVGTRPSVTPAQETKRSWWSPFR